MSLDEIYAQARRELNAQIPDKWRIPKNKLPADEVKDVRNWPKNSGLYSELELEITESTVPQLVQKQTDGEWTSVQITEAFCKRAAHAQQLLNCLVEMFFAEALERAKELDEYREKTGSIVGPLHGVPVSMKDNFMLKGKTEVFGFASQVGKRFEGPEIGLVVQLRDMGAVYYCKTSIPPAMMSPDTYCATFGPTMSPANRFHSPGGSSGGEAALIGFGGSPVGVGSDIGGSIRIPAHSCGIYGLKSTINRFSQTGTKTGLKGQNTVPSTFGPLSRNLESIEYFSESVWNWTAEKGRYCPLVIPIPYRKTELPKRLCFGYFKTDGVAHPSPPVLRAMEVTLEAVRRAGHELIEWNCHRHPEAAQVVFKSFTADGGRRFLELLGDEELSPGNKQIFDHVKDIGAGGVWDSMALKSEIEKEYHNQWKDTAAVTTTGRPIDGIICPVSAMPSRPHADYYYPGYTVVQNALELPGVSFPVLKSDKSIDIKEKREFISDFDKQVWEAYNPEVYDQGTVGLQIVTQKFEDEKAIALAKVVSDALMA
jgi:amidase